MLKKETYYIYLRNMKNFMRFSTAHKPRAYDNALVRFHQTHTYQDRLKAAKGAGWNIFEFPSEMLVVDLLSDSGTTTLTNKQFSQMILGDEAYGTNRGYTLLLEQFEETFGISQEDWEIYLFHQGRAGEHALFSQMGKLIQKATIPSNGHFDTTRANIEANKFRAVNLFSKTLHEEEYHPFKGNMDVGKLGRLLKRNDRRIPIVYTTITNNTGGGQPVSLKNLEETKKLCDKFEKPFFLDACRFAENAWFIKTREEKYQSMPITQVVRKIFSLCDGFTISFKKDGLSHMGGALVIKKKTPFTKKYPKLLNAIRDHQILVEGHPTYGGLTGRDIMIIREGLKTVVTEEYLKSRISQVHQFGDYLDSLGVPVLKPFGGHAVYIDVDTFFKGTRMKQNHFGGITLTALLLLKGIRLCELGAFAFGTYSPRTKKEKFPEYNYVRCAIPRNKYEMEDLYYVADCIGGLYEQRGKLPKAVPVYGRDLTLRHFKARFELK